MILKTHITPLKNKISKKHFQQNADNVITKYLPLNLLTVNLL